MKVSITVKEGVILDIYSRGNVIRIACSFRPSQYPDFTDYLDEKYELRKVSNNADNTGYYVLYIEDAKFKDLVIDLTQAADKLTMNPAPFIHTGKLQEKHAQA